MPVYQHDCPKCRKSHDVVRLISQCGEGYACPDCGGKTSRVYSIFAPKVFQSYSSPYKGGADIRSEREERRVLKANGQVLTADTPAWAKIQRHAKELKRKRIYSTPTTKRGSVTHAK